MQCFYQRFTARYFVQTHEKSIWETGSDFLLRQDGQSETALAHTTDTVYERMVVSGVKERIDELDLLIYSPTKIWR